MAFLFEPALVHGYAILMSYHTGFPPVADKQARLLILGSMPGVKSLEENQYYAHPQNSFWPIMCELLQAPTGLSYKQRKKLLLTYGIALWDVLNSCYREGSLDANIKQQTIMVNDFSAFYQKHPGIGQVFFNGSKAEQLYNKYVLVDLDHTYQQLPRCRLPSTSPAHAMLSRARKKELWKPVTEALDRLDQRMPSA